MDIWSVVQKNERHFCLLNTAYALVSDVDKDSEIFRWMGGLRFTVMATIKFLLPVKRYKAKISFLKAESDFANSGPSSLHQHLPKQEFDGVPLQYYNQKTNLPSQWTEEDDMYSLLLLSNMSWIRFVSS
jgi:hypothetical protein